MYFCTHTAPGSCSEGAVRLMDGVIQQEGRISVGQNRAHVLCQELGYAELGNKLCKHGLSITQLAFTEPVLITAVCTETRLVSQPPHETY